METNHFKPRHHDPYIAFHHIMTAGHAALAAAILVGGPKRFPPPTYQPLLDLTNGRVWPWGMVIGFAAILMMANQIYLDIAGLFIGVCWMGMFSAMFLVSLIYETSGSTAFVAYAIIMMIDAIILVERLSDFVKYREVLKARKA